MQESNNQFGHNPNLKYAIAPLEKPLTGGTSSPEDPKDKEKNKVKNRVLLTAAGITLAAVAATGIGFGVSANQAPEKAPVETSEPSEPIEQPIETPTPVETTAPETQVGPDISKYEAMSIEEFSALTSDEQMIYAAGKLVPGIDQFAIDYQSVSEKQSDILPQGSIDNTAQEIDTLVAYNLRFTLSLSDADREKYIIAILRNNNQSGMYPIIEGLSDNFSGVQMPAKILGYDDLIVTGSATGMSELKQDTFNDQFHEITTTDGPYNAYYVEIPLPDGTTYNTWIRE